jgi:hypothetical protein
MKKLLSILLLCFCFSVSAQYENGVIDIDDFGFVPPTTDNNMSVVFSAGTLNNFVGGLFQGYVNGNPVSAASSVAQDGSVGIAFIGTHCNNSNCNPPPPNSILADNNEVLEYAILINGIIVNIEVDPPLTYSPNTFEIVSGNILFSVNGNPVNYGCMDLDYIEYSSSAQVDDGSCSILKYNGCTEYWADNFDELASDDDGSCYKYGCISEWADNYDEFATYDDGSCELVACNYPYFFEYDSNYTISNPLLCITLIVEGCTNSDAYNYNEEANLNDGSCIVFGCMNEDADNYNPDATIQDNSCVYYGCTNETAENYNEHATDNDGSCIIYGCVLSVFPNYNPEATIDDNSCTFDGFEVYGCTNVSALNYDSLANIDNGACLFNQESEVCSIIIEEEYIPLFLPEGWSMFGYICIESIDLVEALEIINDKVLIVKDYIGNAYLPEWNFNGIGDLIYSRGYQIKTNQEITDFSFCPTIMVTENTPQKEVGDFAEGGIVFYVDETGEHGLVAALFDIEGTHEWGCFEEYVSGADGEAIGTGYQNTMDIVNQGCVTENGGITAAQAALDAEVNGYSDWYLPSKEELYEIYSTIGNVGSEGDIGGFSNAHYRSSSEVATASAWNVSFDNGLAYNSWKNNPVRVRVIRAF